MIIKKSSSSKYSHKPWSDLRRTLFYSRTEARFYSDILPLLREEAGSSWDIAPRCYLAESYLHDLIGEDKSAAAEQENDAREDPKYDKTNDSILRGKGGNLILQLVRAGYYQTLPLQNSTLQPLVIKSSYERFWTNFVNMVVVTISRIVIQRNF